MNPSLRIVSFGQCYGPFLTQTNAEFSYDQRLGRGNRTMFSMSVCTLFPKLLLGNCWTDHTNLITSHLHHLYSNAILQTAIYYPANTGDNQAQVFFLFLIYHKLPLAGIKS